MAITKIDSQGVTMYVVSPSLGETTPTVANIQAGDVITCVQSIGALEETRAVTEYTCMSSNDTTKALGSLTRGSIEVGLLYNPDDALGQDALRTAFATDGDAGQVTIGIELSNTAGVSGTIFAFNAGVSSISTGIVKDEAVTYTVTLEISSSITTIAASAV